MARLTVCPRANHDDDDADDEDGMVIYLSHGGGKKSKMMDSGEIAIASKFARVFR